MILHHLYYIYICIYICICIYIYILYIYDIIGFLMFFHQIISRNDDLVQFSPRSSAARYVRRVRPGARPAPRQCCRRPQRPGPNPPRPLPRPATACPEQRSCDRNLIAVCSLAMITLYTGTIQIKPFLSCKHRHTVQTGASKYSRPSAMLRMPAVLTIRT